jgi:hypothetical protein
MQVRYIKDAHTGSVFIYEILSYRRIQTQIMHQEKCQENNDAKGLDEIACDPPRSPQPMAPTSSGSNGIVVRPHR